MTKSLAVTAIFMLALSGACLAQEWEVSGLGGYSYTFGLEAENQAGATAKTGFHPGAVAGILIGNDMYSRWSGELRYLHRWGAARLEAEGQKVRFDARQHLVHFDMLWHGTDRGARVRPFFAFGAGIRTVQGRGQGAAFQPLFNYAVLTRASQVVPMVDAGFGVKARFGNKGVFRVEVRDYISPGPDEVIAPFPGGRQKGWMHDLIPAVGIGLTW